MKLVILLSHYQMVCFSKNLYGKKRYDFNIRWKKVFIRKFVSEQC